MLKTKYHDRAQIEDDLRLCLSKIDLRILQGYSIKHVHDFDYDDEHTGLKFKCKDKTRHCPSAGKYYLYGEVWLWHAVVVLSSRNPSTGYNWGNDECSNLQIGLWMLFNWPNQSPYMKLIEHQWKELIMAMHIRPVHPIWNLLLQKEAYTKYWWKGLHT